MPIKTARVARSRHRHFKLIEMPVSVVEATVVLAVVFAVATSLGWPEWAVPLRPMLRNVAWVCVTGAVILNVWDHWASIQAFRTKVGNAPLTLLVVGAMGAATAIGLFKLWPVTAAKRSPIAAASMGESKTDGPIKTVQQHPTTVATADEARPLLDPLPTSYRDAVVEVIKEFSTPSSRIIVGGGYVGPDGMRTIDIQIFSEVQGKMISVGVDVIDRPDGASVSIDTIDVADAKRKDLRFDSMIVCSSTGFTDDAIRKGRRIDVTMLSAVKRGDGRIKTVIEEEIYLRRIRVLDYREYYGGWSEPDRAVLKTLKSADVSGIKYSGVELSKWLREKMTSVVIRNSHSPLLVEARKDGGVVADYQFKVPLTVETRSGKARLKDVRIVFGLEVEWFAQMMRVDATVGLYDYARGKLKLGPGQQQYFISGINLETATPIDRPARALLEEGKMEEIVVGGFVFFEGIGSLHDEDTERVFSEIDKHVRPEDLVYSIVDVPLATKSH